MKGHRKLVLVGVVLVLAGSLTAHLIQTSGQIRIRDVRFQGARAGRMSALLYVPANASAATPAPGILAVHGYINSRETQDGFAIEFARRGYVVLALDQTGHGYSDPPAFAHGFGGPDGLDYLRSLDIVDKNNIGLEGHSMGGWTVLAAAAAYPKGYQAMVLEGSSTGPPFAADGSAQWPRNLALVFSEYDEFSALMWGVTEARNVANSHKLWKVFGAEAPVQTGVVYGKVEEGTARVLYTPAVTHPMDHISPEAIGYSLDWFQRNLKGGRPLPSGNQIWYWKEIGTLVALAGFLVLLLGTFDWLLTRSYFASLAQGPIVTRDARNWRWCLTLALMASVPVLTYFRFFQWGASWLPPSVLFPQGITSQIMIWALLNAVISVALMLVLRGSAGFTTRWLRSVQIAVLTVCIGYASLWAVDFLFKTDYRFWVVAFKLMSLTQFKYFLVYLLPFTVFFAVTLRGLHAGLAVKGDSAAKQYLSNVAALSLGFLVFLLLEYIPLFVRGRLLTSSEPLNVIVAIQFLPLMAMIAIIATFTYRRTNSYLPGAVICGLLVTWYMVAGQATQAAVR
ncbi:MAG TPA: alpha/beta fold hydrolase [Candidatus Saccharimonadales bacterium]|nr:alpha/beta fold hydrolase [Candidatus Saccharimonadales bacterium]